MVKIFFCKMFNFSVIFPGKLLEISREFKERTVEPILKVLKYVFVSI